MSTSTVGQVLVFADQGTHQAHVGDLIQLPVTRPVVPGRMVFSLDIEVEGDAVREVTQAHPPDPGGHPRVGSNSILAILVADKVGSTVVTVTPVGDRPQEPLVYNIEVQDSVGDGR